MGIRDRCVQWSSGRRTQGIREHLRISSLRAARSPGSQMFCRHHGKGHRPPRSTMENSCWDEAAARTRRTGRTSPRAQSVKNSSARRYGLRALVGRRGGFLRSPLARPTRGPQRIISGAGQKRKSMEEGKTPVKKPKVGPRPVISMLLSVGTQDHRVRILLDTGCLIPLINQKMAGRLGITLQKHNQTIPIENFTGQTVEGVGQYYTEPLLLRHR